MAQHLALRLHEEPAARLRLEAIDTPDLTPGELRVRLHAAALNHRDQWQREGLYPGLAYPCVMGSDGAGMVVAAASPADAHWVGREVIVNPNNDWGSNPEVQQPSYHIRGVPSSGTFQELLALPTHRLYPKPAHLSMEQAAALPLAGLTAYRAVFYHGHCRPGQRVLVSGIGGGVAQFAAQFALAVGASVYVTSSDTAKAQRLLDLGARGFANYRSEGWAKSLKAQAGGGFDLVIDSAGGAQFNTLLDLVRPAGRIVFYGATAGNVPEFNLRKVFWNQITVQGSTMGSDSDFEAMLRFVSEHRIVPIVSSVRPFREIVSAFDELDAGRQFGKLVVRMDT